MRLVVVYARATNSAEVASTRAKATWPARRTPPRRGEATACDAPARGDPARQGSHDATRSRVEDDANPAWASSHAAPPPNSTAVATDAITATAIAIASSCAD